MGPVWGAVNYDYTPALMRIRWLITTKQVVWMGFVLCEVVFILYYSKTESAATLALNNHLNGHDWMNCNWL